MPPDATFWAICCDLLACQRSHDDGQLAEYLKEDPTIGLPPQVRRALLLAAEAAQPDLVGLAIEPVPLLAPDAGARPTPTVFHDIRAVRLEAPLLSAAPTLPAELPAGLKSFLTKHAFLQPPLGGRDEHYAERRFLLEVLYPLLGDEGLRHLTPQKDFEGADGRPRRIDFELRGAGKYAIEIEGATYHDRERIGPDRFTDEKRRQRALADGGYEYIPFSFAEIDDGSALESFRRLCTTDSALAWMLRQPKEGLGVVNGAGGIHAARRLVGWAPGTFVRTQRALLPLLADWVARGKHVVRVLEVEPEIGVLALALADLLTFVDRVAALVGVDLVLPTVKVTSLLRRGPDDTLATVLGAYFGNERYVEDGADRRQERPRKPFRWCTAESVAATDFDGAFALEGPGVLPGGLRPYSPQHLAQLSASGNWARPADPLAPYQARRPDKGTLDYFARRFFAIPQLHEEQYEVIASLLEGRSPIVVLPTAFGKSVCFQLPALIVPGVLLVVSPLRALIRDQLESLARRGLTCGGAITFEDSAAAKEQKLRDLGKGRYRLFYVAPERIQVRKFADEVRAQAARWGTWALAVDEAHCISEWGHDFRPAYLQLGRFRRELAGHDGQVPVLALTATASPPVKQDIANILEIAEEPVTLVNTDRPEISLSVHRAGTMAEKPVGLAGILAEQIPRALGQEPGQLLTEPPYADGTVVFTIYADPHGKQTWHHGVTAIRDALIEKDLVRDEQIAVHSSTAPGSCPSCSSSRYQNESGRRGGRFRCLSCGDTFVRPDRPTEAAWLASVARTQDDFKADRFPVLVATKGYGMGIDKRNIRVIAHHDFAGGIESYYQEVGRAGRDKRHSHAALVYTPPAPQCAERLARARTDIEEVYQEFEPACVQGSNFKFWKCPYKLEGLCDYGLQARFIHQAYPGEAHDVEATLNVLAQLACAGAEVQVAVVGDERIKEHQLALYRLQQLGLVRDYALDYQSLARVQLRVRVDPAWTFAKGKQALAKALKQLLLSDREERAVAVDRDVAALRALRGASPQEQVRPLLELLIARVYRTVKAMRYRMLHTHWEYARIEPEGECRRAVLRRTFDSVLRAGEDCGFCDCCVPDLRFAADHAHVAAGDTTLELLSRDLPKVFSRFDPEEAVRTVEIAAARGALGSLQGQAEYYLESDPGSLGAYKIAGLAATGRGRADDALRHFTAGYVQNEREGRRPDRAGHFYELAHAVDPLRAVDLPDRVGGLYDTCEGRRFVLGELERIADAPPERVTVMRGVVVCDELERVDAEAMPALLDATRSLLGACPQL